MPGVLIFDRVEQAISKQLPAKHIAHIDECKFLVPLLPGQTFDIYLRNHGDSVLFECRTAQTLCASGRIRLSDHA